MFPRYKFAAIRSCGSEGNNDRCRNLQRASVHPFPPVFVGRNDGRIYRGIPLGYRTSRNRRSTYKQRDKSCFTARTIPFLSVFTACAADLLEKWWTEKIKDATTGENERERKEEKRPRSRSKRYMGKWYSERNLKKKRKEKKRKERGEKKLLSVYCQQRKRGIAGTSSIASDRGERGGWTSHRW